jgi:hypothetical protein
MAFLLSSPNHPCFPADAIVLLLAWVSLQTPGFCQFPSSFPFSLPCWDRVEHAFDLQEGRMPRRATDEEE